MKSILNIYSALFLCMLFVFASCTDEAKYDPAAQLTNQQIYFPNTLPAKQELSKEKTSFNIELKRLDKADDFSVILKVSQEGEDFVIPTIANFAAGEESTTITIAYDPDALEYDDFHPVTISLADVSYTTYYGKSDYKFEAGVPAPWESIGKGQYMDNWAFGDDEGFIEVEFQRHMINPNRYRVESPYREGDYVDFDILPVGSVHKGVTITMEGLVNFVDFYVGYNTNYSSDIFAFHPSRFLKYVAESFWKYNSVKQYSVDNKPEIIYLAPYYYMDGIGGWDVSQSNGIITIVFPGVELSDYSVEIAYKGRYTDESEKDYAIAKVILGEDVVSAKVALIQGDDAESAIEGVIDGTLTSVEISESGDVQIPCENTGQYMFVVVTFNDEGDPKESASRMFRFVSSHDVETWTSLGMATYTDGFVALYYGAKEAPTYQIEIQESDQNPGKFRLVNPYGADYPYNEPGDWDDSRNYYLEINAMDPQGVYIDFQNTGLNWGDGDYYAYSFASYFMDNGNTFEEVKAEGFCGTFVNGIITFPINNLLGAFPESGDMFYANMKGEFKLVMPGADLLGKRSFGTSNYKSFTKELKVSAIKKRDLVLMSTAKLDN